MHGSRIQVCDYSMSSVSATLDTIPRCQIIRLIPPTSIHFYVTMTRKHFFASIRMKFFFILEKNMKSLKILFFKICYNRTTFLMLTSTVSQKLLKDVIGQMRSFLFKRHHQGHRIAATKRFIAWRVGTSNIWKLLCFFSIQTSKVWVLLQYLWICPIR